MTDPISLSDPDVIIAGIKQFGLAPDGSDLRDLSASIERLRAHPPVSAEREALEKLPSTQEYFLRAMATNYSKGHCWDGLDAQTCVEAADEIKALRAALSAEGRSRAGQPFYGAQCPSYPNCSGGCGLGCTHEIEAARTARSAGQSDKPVVSVKPMALSDGRTDYFVSIKVGERDVTPHVFREEYKAAYHVALYDWLLNGVGEEPCPVDFGPDDWPAKVHTPVDSDTEAGR